MAGPTPAARAGTIAFFLAIGLIGWFLATRASEAKDPTDGADRASADPTQFESLPPGTYRLPGLTAPVSITVPSGWTAGGSSWGPASQGVAAITTGPPGAAISVAVLDLETLRPVDPRTGEPSAGSVGNGWFRRWVDDYAARVAPRVRDRSVGRRVDWTPPPALAWLLTFTHRGRVGFADDIAFDDLPGDLATFAFPGPRRTIFRTSGGDVTLRPGVTYTFWAPRSGPDVPRVVLGIARELGAVPGTAEWDVVRTIELGT